MLLENKKKFPLNLFTFGKSVFTIKIKLKYLYLLIHKIQITFLTQIQEYSH